MKKSLYCQAAAAVMALTMILAGCTNANVSSGKNSKTGSKDSTAESLKSSSLKYELNDELDFGGREITISCWGAVPTRDQSEYFERRYIRSERTEKKYNVKFNWIPVPDTTTFVRDVALAYASGKKYADLMYCTSFFGFDLAKLGAILPLDDYIDYDSAYYQMNGDLLKYVDGKHYSYFPDEYSPSSCGFTIMYNTTLTEAALSEGEDPLTLYEQGKWDWEAFANVVKKTTKISSSGEVTQWGCGGGWLLDALCMSNGFSPISMSNNKFVCELYGNRGINVLDFIRRLGYEYKGLDSNYESNAVKRAFNQNKLAMAISPNWTTAYAIKAGIPVQCVPLPVGPDADGQKIGTEFQEWWVVNSLTDFDVKDLLQVALDMNENDPAYEDTYQTPKIVKEKYITRMYEGNAFLTEEEGEMFFDLMADASVEKIVDLVPTDMRYTLHSKIQLPLYTGENSRTVLERMKPVIDAALEDLLPDR